MSTSRSIASRMRSWMSARSSTERVELADRGRELVVELRQHPLLHVLHGDVERGRLAGDARVLVIRGQRQIDVALVARLHADQALLELGRQPAGAELDAVVGAGAVVERLAVDRALEVDDEEVALRRAALDRVQLCDASAQPLDLGVDRLVAAPRPAAVRPRAPCRP